MRLLLIEDDLLITQALKVALAATYRLDCAYDGTAGLDLAANGSYDLVILDVNLPDTTGMEVCKRLRSDNYSGPILVLSGETRIMTKITLLDMGADDYLTKPFSLGELKARLRVLMRRARLSATGQSLLTTGDLTLDRATHQVKRGSRIIQLRPKEFALLECLMQRVGTVVTREILSAYAWRQNEDPWTNTIEVHIKHLRDKIDRSFPAPVIKTVHGIGYKLELPKTGARECRRARQDVQPAGAG